MSLQTANILTTFLYHTALLLYSQATDHKLLLLILSSALGLVSYTLFRNYTRASKSIYLRLSSRIYGAFYLFEMNWAAYKEFEHSVKGRIDAFLVMFALIHIAKAIFVEIARPKLDSTLKWYRDVLALENHFHMARFGTRLGTDELTIEYIKNTAKGHNSRLLFSILCDNAAMNELSGRFELLASVKKDMGIDSLANMSSDAKSEIPGTEDSNSDEPILFEDPEPADTNSKTLRDVSQTIDPNSYQMLAKLERLEMTGLITEYSLLRCFEKKDARECLRILTQGFETELNYSDFHDSMRQINIERNALTNFIEGSDYTASILTLSSFGIECILVLSLFAKLFNIIDLIQFVVVPLLVFVFPVCLNLFDAFVFILYMHPYDIGDRIMLEEDNLVVKRIGLTSTVFERWNNEIVIISNGYIKSKLLKNIRRSKCQQLRIEMAISRGDLGSMEKLNRTMSAFAAENPAFENFELTLDEIFNNSFVKVGFVIKHSINHQNGFFMWHVQNKFMKRLLKELSILDIKYSPIEMNVKVD